MRTFIMAKYQYFLKEENGILYLFETRGERSRGEWIYSSRNLDLPPRIKYEQLKDISWI